MTRWVYVHCLLMRYPLEWDSASGEEFPLAQAWLTMSHASNPISILTMHNDTNYKPSEVTQIASIFSKFKGWDGLPLIVEEQSFIKFSRRSPSNIILPFLSYSFQISHFTISLYIYPSIMTWRGVPQSTVYSSFIHFLLFTHTNLFWYLPVSYTFNWGG